MKSEDGNRLAAGPDCKEGGRKSPSWRDSLKHLCEPHVYTTQSTMNLSCALSFCMKKTNHSTYLTAGRSSDNSVRVSSVITPTLCSESVW